ncbi:MAG: DUF2393 family protein [Campylobacterota bacterium]|nr:DUF2393 family protein [Campylobacterota bacterium]
MTHFTFIHYLVLLVVALLFVLTVILSLREKKTKIRTTMILSSLAVMVLIASFFMMALDKYTKIAEIRGLKNTRMLMNEQIVYSGYVHNAGKFKIGKVELEIKLVNKGHVTGNVKGGSFYKPSGFWDFFGGGEAAKRKARPQTIIRTFVVAEDLKPGKAKYFSVRMPYPPYFKHTADYTRVFAH